MNSISTVACIIAIIGLSTTAVAFPDSRIINGDLASQSQFPWHALITARYNNAPIRYFGGSLISQNFVLTIAHYLIGSQSIQIQMGSTEFYRPLVTMESQTYFIHPNFNAATYAFDIALIQLPSNLQYSNNIRPITLPSRSQSNNQFVGVNALISGFGVTSQQNNYLSEKLRFARVTVISDSVCAQSIPSLVQPTVVCAVPTTYLPQSGTACYGDTGGALVINEGNLWTQIGLASMYPNGCNGNVPTMYTRVTYALDWISNISGVPVRS